MITIEVGVISDTHGILHEESVAALQSVDIERVSLWFTYI